MERIIRELKGHSGSIVELIENEDGIFVRKTHNVDRNHERLTALDPWVRVPEIYLYNEYDELLEMEYIFGNDMKSYLLYNTTLDLKTFLIGTIATFQNSHETSKDYSRDYFKFLDWVDDTNDFGFTAEQIFHALPKRLPQSVYHGDFTLENIIHSSADDDFVLIDPVTVPFDSWVFDVAKLRQDLDCKWFIRGSNLSLQLDHKLLDIRQDLLELFPDGFHDSLLILMLLRVYKHCTIDSPEYPFIVREINKLWSKI